MDASTVDILRWNWHLVALPLGVGGLGLLALVRGMNTRPPTRTAIAALAWGVVVALVAGAIVVSNGAFAHEAAASAHDPSPAGVLMVWGAARVVTVGALTSGAVALLALLALSAAASRRAV